MRERFVLGRFIGNCPRFAQSFGIGQRSCGLTAAKAALFAFLSSFALIARYTEGSTSLLDLLYGTFADNLLLASVLTLVLFRFFQRPHKLSLPAVIVSLLFSVSIVVGRAFLIRENYGGTYSYGSFAPIACDHAHLLFSMLMFLGIFVLAHAAVVELFAILDVSVRCTRGNFVRDKPSATGEVREMGKGDVRSADADVRWVRKLANQRVAMAVIIVLWLPYIVVFFPGCIQHDAASQICQFFGYEQLTSHHPILTTYLFGALISIGRAFGSDAVGVFFITFFLVVALSYACSRIVECAASLLDGVTLGSPSGRRISLSVVATVLLIAFFALSPLFGSAATSIKKDALFYAFFALFVLAGVDLVLPKRQLDKRFVFARLTLWGTLVALVRNDGFIFVAIELACLAIVTAKGFFGEKMDEAGDVLLPRVLRSAVFRSLASLMVIALVYFGGYRALVMPLLNVEAGSIGEALTIPIQQVARFYVQASEDVDESISAGIGRLLDESGLNDDVYDPMLSDNIKFTYFNDDCSAEDIELFAQSYLQAGLKHPSIFASAFVDQTLGWWYIEEAGQPDKAVGNMGLYQNVPKTEIYSVALDFDMPFLNTGLMTAFRRLLMSFSYIPLVGLVTYPPIYFWVMVLLFAWGASRRNPMTLMLVPLFGYYAICLASPVSGLLRYIIPVAMTLPVVASLLVAQCSGAKGGKQPASDCCPDPTRART